MCLIEPQYDRIERFIERDPDSCKLDRGLKWLGISVAVSGIAFLIFSAIAYSGCVDLSFLGPGTSSRAAFEFFITGIILHALSLSIYFCRRKIRQDFLQLDNENQNL